MVGPKFSYFGMLGVIATIDRGVLDKGTVTTGDVAGWAPAVSIEGGVRLKWVYLGLNLEGGWFGKKDKVSDLGNGSITSNSTTYFGGVLGLLPYHDRVSFWGDVNAGIRSLNQTITYGAGASSVGDVKANFTGVEAGAALGLSIPVSKYFLLVPKLGMGFGFFGSLDQSPAKAGYYTGTAVDRGGTKDDVSLPGANAHFTFYMSLAGLANFDL
jgi:hypothetical protein